MKLNKHEKIENSNYEMFLLVEPDEFKDAVSKAYRKEVKKYNVPGFRKGRAPRNLIEKMYGHDIFYYDALNEVFPVIYEEAVAQVGIEPVDSPQVSPESMSLEEGAVLKVTVTIKPELNIKDYEGLQLERSFPKVEDDMIESEIARMQERNSRLIAREGKAQNGDIVTLDYEGSVDGVPFDGGKAEGHKLTLGSEQFIKGFEEKLIGHEVGESFDIDVTFPEEYHAENLAGKPAVFHVTIHEIQFKELPELDDEFAKDVSDFETLAELKDDITKKLQEQLDAQAEQEMESMLAELLVEKLEGDVPEVMIENRVDEMVQDFAMRLQQQGLDIKNYLQFTGGDMEAFRDGFRKQAQITVKMRLALEAVARIHALQVEEAELSEEFKKIAEKYQMDEETVRKLMPEDDIKKDLVITKALSYVKSKAEIAEKKVEKAVEKASKKAEKAVEKAEKAAGKTAEKAEKAEKAAKKAEKAVDKAVEKVEKKTTRKKASPKKEEDKSQA